MAETKTVDLATVEIQDARAVFTTPAAEKPMQPYLDRVREVVDAFGAAKHDTTTEEGRDAIRSMAFKIGKVKTAIEKHGKAVADEVKALPKIVDANRKAAFDTLDKWQAEVRKPLTDWETAEEARKKAHIDRLNDIAALRQALVGLSMDELESRAVTLVELATFKSEKLGEEFAEQYGQEVRDTHGALQSAIAVRKRVDAEQAELATLRAEKQAREAREAEERAKAEQERREREEAERAAQAAQEAAERAEREADERALQAVAHDRLQREAEESAIREAAEKRAADEAHRTAVIEAAVQALIDTAGLDRYGAQDAVKAIIAGQIPAITIQF